MPQPMKTAIRLTFSALLFLALVACATTAEIKPQLLTPSVPAGVRTCKDLPTPPPQPYKQKAVGLYIVALRDVVRNCKGNLGAVNTILTDFERKAAELEAAGTGTKVTLP